MLPAGCSSPPLGIDVPYFLLPALNTHAPLFPLRTLAVWPDARNLTAALLAAVMVVWQLTFLYLRVFLTLPIAVAMML